MSETEIQAGDEATKRIENLREEEIKMMTAITRDPNPIHFDRQVIDQMGLPGLVNQGASNLSYFVQGVNEFADRPEEVVNIDVRFESQVFEGDSLTTTVTVEEVESDGENIVCELSGTVEKDGGTVAMTGTATLVR